MRVFCITKTGVLCHHVFSSALKRRTMSSKRTLSLLSIIVLLLAVATLWTTAGSAQGQRGAAMPALHAPAVLAIALALFLGLSVRLIRPRGLPAERQDHRCHSDQQLSLHMFPLVVYRPTQHWFSGLSTPTRILTR